MQHSPQTRPLPPEVTTPATGVASTGFASDGRHDMGLLVLRLWFGLSLLILHGWGKVTGFSTMSAQFPDPIGIGPTATLVVAILCEVVAALLLVVGLFTRWAAAAIGLMMILTWMLVHRGAFSGPQGGELAFLYAGAAIALALAGPGRFSVDAQRARHGTLS